MKRISTLILVIAMLGAVGEVLDLYNHGVNLNRHIPFLYTLVLLFFWVCIRFLEKEGRLPSSHTTEPANDDGRIPEHARMRANTPDGLG